MVVGVLLPLVARAGALAEVDSVLAAARTGRDALVAVTGEPGIGKTRLAEAAADRAAGFEVIWTWCPPAAGGAPLRPWARVVRTLAAGRGAAARLVADSPFLAALAGPARDPGRDPADPEGARSQLSFDLAEVIAAAAQPVLVVIDDAHQADTSSLRLLAELAPALRAMPAAVLVTARDGDQAWQGRLDERSALLRSGLVITLLPFAEGDAAGLVASLTGAPPAPDLVRVIAERSGGNPLLVVELARQVSRQGSGDAAAARVVVPEPVRMITHSRLAELSVPARSVLKADAPVSLDEPEIEGLYAELDDYTVAFETHKDDVDPAPFFRGLPDDRCQCPHWGVVLSGRIIFRYPGYDEVYTAGDAYYAVPGHLPLLFAGTELVEFSPTGPLAESMAVIGKNLQAREA